MRKWVDVVTTGVLLVSLLSVAACTKSKLPPAPTVVETGQTPSADQTLTPGSDTVVDVDATPTSGADVETPIPTMTTQVEATATPTVVATPASPAATPGAPSAGEFAYVVKSGDTLWSLARRFGTTVQAIKSRNGLTSNVIYRGRELIVPGSAGGATVTHVVQRGENLFRIALKYGTTVEAIAAANNLINPSFVYAGQRLVIPQGSTAPGGGVRYHVVQRGETLSSIAVRYGTTPSAIALANGISNPNFIYAGRTLRIP